jgi:hypothetical protein
MGAAAYATVAGGAAVWVRLDPSWARTLLVLPVGALAGWCFAARFDPKVRRAMSRSTSSSGFTPGDVWFACPARLGATTDGPEEHPVMVLRDDGGLEVLCVSFTSQSARTGQFDRIRCTGGWVDRAGKDASFARMERAPETVARATFRRHLGRVTDTQWAEIAGHIARTSGVRLPSRPG